MRNGATSTRCTGCSSSLPSAWPMRNPPPGIAIRSFSSRWFALIFVNRKLQFPFVTIDAIENHPEFVSDREFAPRAAAHYFANILLISVLVAGEGVDGHQPFDEQVG